MKSQPNPETENDVAWKLHRIRQGGAPRVLDLFAGCGGISLGFAREGFSIAAAVENDPEAVATHARNFHGQLAPTLVQAHGMARDIIRTEPTELVRAMQLGPTTGRAIDVVVGGPPCQSFARVGRAKLREVLDHPQAFRKDGRSRLYLRYLDYVREFHPLAILVENVPDVINHGGHNVPHEMCEVLSELGYECRYTLLNAAHYGVPQMRDRMFLMGLRRELGRVPSFPAPSHWTQLPRGYYGTRSVALKHVQRNLLEEATFFEAPPVPMPQLQRAVTAREALGDLPSITRHLRGELKRGPARFEELVRYRPSGLNAYARLMREWPGMESRDGGVYDHVIRYLPRDYAIFARMKGGDQYPEAHALAVRMFEEALATHPRPPVANSEEWLALRAGIVPPYDPGKFPNKWRKMEADAPARTLMAHIGKDSYSHIHYDDAQARTISVREAARLQSFPDGFTLVGRMNSALRQIGNAVPPLMSAALAAEVRSALAGEADAADEATLATAA